MTDINTVLKKAIEELSQTSDSPRIDAEILLAYTLTKTRTYLYTHGELLLSSQQLQTFQQLIAKRLNGMPIAYLTGTREFWSLPLQVNEHTLIPRPETELLVELTLKLLQPIHNAKLLDLGTGSGAIALALAKERPDWQITAIDCSLEALKVAQHNAKNLKLTTINFCQSDWFNKLNPQHFFHAIIANPPYIAENDHHLTIGDLRFEPKTALVSGSKGLDALQHIINNSLARLTAGGLLLLEHGSCQRLAITAMLEEKGYIEISCWQDWQGYDRVSGGRKN